jgi:hypothetical protein
MDGLVLWLVLFLKSVGPTGWVILIYVIGFHSFCISVSSLSEVDKIA